MDYKYIEQLLDRYFECETTLEEEQILRTFFSQENVPARLLAYKEIFAAQQKEQKTDVLSDDFDSRIMAMIAEEEAEVGLSNDSQHSTLNSKEPIHVKARIITMRRRLRPLYKAVAVVAVILTLGNAAQMPYERAYTQDAKQFAEEHAKDTATVQGKATMAMADSLRLDSIKSRANAILK